MQIRQHVAPGLLRVHVLGSSSSSSGVGGGGGEGGRSGGYSSYSNVPAHELAWEYDVVLTSFNRLSNDWSSRNDMSQRHKHVLLKVGGEGGI